MVTALGHYEFIGCLCGLNAFPFILRCELAPVTGIPLVNPVAGLLLLFPANYREDHCNVLNSFSCQLIE